MIISKREYVDFLVSRPSNRRMEGPIYKGGQAGRCPNCQLYVRFENSQGVGYHFQWTSPKPGQAISVMEAACPDCGHIVLSVGHSLAKEPIRWFVAWPRAGSRSAPGECPEEIAAVFHEAALVLHLSPQASAALSRRCLEQVLAGEGFDDFQLAAKVNGAIERYPEYVGKFLHHLREIGNMAAHVWTSEHTGEIIQVADGEAELMLEVLEELFDHVYVKPARAQAKIDELNRKQREAGRRET